MLIGSHCSLALPDMFLGSVKEALSYNANCLMVYTGAPQTTLRSPIDKMKILEAHELMKQNGLSLANVVVHAPYIMNPATKDIEKRDFCINFLASEIKRTAAMGVSVIVLHPGNSLDLEREVALNNIANVLNQVIAITSDLNVIIALETMAGKGTECGKTFEELKYIIDLVEDKNRIGVCLDTCHINDAGYDLVNHYEDVLNEFDSILGLDMIKAIHVNDSKNPLGAHKDRHANIGTGFIGLDTLKKICEDRRFLLIPKILETPYIDGNAPYKEEICMLRN